MNISYSTSSEFYNKISSNGNTYISSYRKRVREADTVVQDLQEDIESFRRCVRNLKNYDSDTITRSKLEKYLDKFAETYNELQESGEKITDSELSKTLTKLEDFMEENKKGLKKLGLKESDGEWIFDKELLEETKDSDIDKLFEGKDAIFRQIDKLMRQVEKKADEEEYEMVLRNFHTVTKYSEEEMEQAMNAHYIHGVLGSLQSSNAEVQSYDSSTGDISKDVTLGLECFSDTYNSFISSATDVVNENVSHMIEKTEANKSNLALIGITMGADGTLTYSSSATIDDSYKQAYAALFGENAAYGNLMKTYAKNIFNITMKTESLGITIDSYA